MNCEILHIANPRVRYTQFCIPKRSSVRTFTAIVYRLKPVHTTVR